MKRFLPLLLVGSAQAATIITTDVYISSVDVGNYRVIAPAEDLAPGGPGAAVDWFPYGWHGFGGGQMIVELEVGETVSLATVGGLQLSLSGQDVGPNRQLWFFDDPNFGDNPYWGQISGPLPVKYEVTTNLGTTSKTMTIIPEPSSACLAFLGAGLLWRRQNARPR